MIFTVDKNVYHCIITKNIVIILYINLLSTMWFRENATTNNKNYKSKHLKSYKSSTSLCWFRKTFLNMVGVIELISAVIRSFKSSNDRGFDWKTRFSGDKSGLRRNDPILKKLNWTNWINFQWCNKLHNYFAICCSSEQSVPHTPCFLWMRTRLNDIP